MRHRGDRWNESQVSSDALTGRRVVRVTTAGQYNEKPSYHTGTTFTADGDAVLFATGRDGMSALCRAEVGTGEITQLTEPVRGMGGRWLTHKDGVSDVADGMGISGITACMAPRSRQALYVHHRSIKMVHLDTMVERTLVADFGEDWIEGVLSVDPTETTALLALMPAHPDIVAGVTPARPYLEAFAAGGMRTRYLEVPLDGRPSRVVFEDEGVGCAHSPHCPSDRDLVLIDRDLPPLYWCGGDKGATNRCWTLRLSTGKLTPLVPRNRHRFQVHAAWSWDGRHVFYHSWRGEGGWYVGVAEQTGEVVREYEFGDARGYGHVAAAPDRQAVILDGNVTEDQITYLHWDASVPRMEPIARHATVWGCMRGQYADPHPTTDPTGRWICCNTARSGRSDILVIDTRG